MSSVDPLTRQHLSSSPKSAEETVHSARTKMTYSVKVLLIVSVVLFNVSLLGALLLVNSSSDSTGSTGESSKKSNSNSATHGDLLSKFSRPLPVSFRRIVFTSAQDVPVERTKSFGGDSTTEDKGSRALRKCEGLYLMEEGPGEIFVHEAIESVCMLKCLVLPTKNENGLTYYDESKELNLTLNENKPCDSKAKFLKCSNGLCIEPYGSLFVRHSSAKGSPTSYYVAADSRDIIYDPFQRGAVIPKVKKNSVVEVSLITSNPLEQNRGRGRLLDGRHTSVNLTMQGSNSWQRQCSNWGCIEWLLVH